MQEITRWSLSLDDFAEKAFDYLERHHDSGNHHVFIINAYKEYAAREIALSLIPLIQDMLEEDDTQE